MEQPETAENETAVSAADKIRQASVEESNTTPTEAKESVDDAVVVATAEPNCVADVTDAARERTPPTWRRPTPEGIRGFRRPTPPCLREGTPTLPQYPSPTGHLSRAVAAARELDEREAELLAEEDGPSPLERLHEKWNLEENIESEYHLRAGRPAGQMFEQQVKDCYERARSSVARSRGAVDAGEFVVARRRRAGRPVAPYALLDSDDEDGPTSSFVPSRRLLRYDETGVEEDVVSQLGSGPYAAPTVSRSRGIERPIGRGGDGLEEESAPQFSRRHHLAQAYRQRAATNKRRTDDDDEDVSDGEVARLTSSARPYYSRPNRDDPDYFDYDLEHSVTLFQSMPTYRPRQPQLWEQKLLNELTKSKVVKPIATHMFLHETASAELANEQTTAAAAADWRDTNAGLVSCALRTPSFWQNRFEKLLNVEK